jgi:hypothetical protein
LRRGRWHHTDPSSRGIESGTLVAVDPTEAPMDRGKIEDGVKLILEGIG